MGRLQKEPPAPGFIRETQFLRAVSAAAERRSENCKSNNLASGEKEFGSSSDIGIDPRPPWRSGRAAEGFIPVMDRMKLSGMDSPFEIKIYLYL